MFGHSVSLIFTFASLATLGIKLFALGDIAFRPSEAFPFLDRMTKPAWLAIAGASIFGHLLTGPFGLFGIAGLVACSVYLVDIRPKIIQMQDNSRR